MQRLRKLSKDFTDKIIELVAGKIAPELLDNFFNLVESEIKNHYFTHSSESNLLRIIQHQYDIYFFVSGCVKYPHHVEILVSISSHSNYLTDILVRNPEYFYWIVNPSNLTEQPDEKYFNDAIEKNISLFKNFNSKVTSLRNLKRKELLRIGLKDFFIKEDLTLITKQLSFLAKAISKKLFEICYEEILNKYELSNIKSGYCLISLGKLGGSELNYSSDIDLIAFYEKNTFIKRKIYYNQIISEAIKLFVENSTLITPNGYVYRVDFRLRPDGRNSPLCGSLAEYLRYYESRGEAWERQMLIKSDFLCGNKNLYKKFNEYISHFVYPKSFLSSPLEQLKKLKQSIEGRAESDLNIKLSSGGIRDIEFSVQALQLLNGGKDLQLRTPNTLKAIEALNYKKLLDDSETETFKNAYILYRKIEHYVQLMNDRQTHQLPETGELTEKIASYLGYQNGKELIRKIDELKKVVSKIYLSIVNSGIDNKAETRFHLSDVRSQNNLEYLKTGKGLLGTKQFDLRTTESFEAIESTLYENLDRSFEKELVLENFVKVVKSLSIPKLFYNELRDDNFLKLFLNLCEFSQRSVDMLSSSKYLVEEFISRKTFRKLSEEELKALDYSSLIFRLAAQVISHQTKAIEVPTIISTFFLNQLTDGINNFSSGKKWRNNFAVFGLGSFGSDDMTFSSDIDLIFVVKEINKFPEIEKDFKDLLQYLKSETGINEIDCRLRPEGKSSQLVWDIDEYKKYLTNRARVWEFFAFTKLKFITGEKSLQQNFRNFFISATKAIDERDIVKDLKEMRKKLHPLDERIFNLKKSKGSLLDIDFIIGSELLKNIDQYQNLIGRSTLTKLDNLIEKNKKKTIFNELKKNYLNLKALEIYIQIAFNTKLTKLPSDENKLTTISKLMGFKDQRVFSSTLNSIIKSNQTIFNEYFSQ